MPGRVYLHVGLPKTGTSSIQRSLQLSRQRLDSLGYTVPGPSRLAQREAVWDLLGRRVGGSEARGVPGSWQRLLDEIHANEASTHLVSEELLVHARRRQAQRIARALEPLELNVVVTVRDLALAAASMWQQEVFTGATWPWRDYAATVADPDSGAPTAGVAFWLRYDVGRVVDTWATVCPASCVHIVVTPRPGADPAQLLNRFGEAVGLPAGALRVPTRVQNVSVGPLGSELVRRLNEQLPAALTEQERLRLSAQVLKPALRVADSSTAATPLAFTDATFSALQRRAAAMAASIQAGGQHVVGDVSDLVPAPGTREGVDPGALPESELLGGALRVLAVVSTHAARAGGPTPAAETTPTTPRPLARAGSALRARGFRLRTRLLTRADSSEGLAWAARRYLRRHQGG